jgi:hypothetical protein
LVFGVGYLWLAARYLGNAGGWGTVPGGTWFAHTDLTECVLGPACGGAKGGKTGRFGVRAKCRLPLSERVRGWASPYSGSHWVGCMGPCVGGERIGAGLRPATGPDPVHFVATEPRNFKEARAREESREALRVQP